MKPGIRLEQRVHRLAQVVALARLLAVREQAEARLVDPLVDARVLAAHDRELARATPAVQSTVAPPSTRICGARPGHRDRHRDRGPGGTLDATHAQQRRGHGRAGVARAGHRVGLAVAHELGARSRSKRPSWCAPTPAGRASRRPPWPGRAPRRSWRRAASGGSRAPTRRGGPHAELVGRLDRARDDLAGGAVAPHRVDGNGDGHGRATRRRSPGGRRTSRSCRTRCGAA